MNRRGDAGFTLIETLVALAVLATAAMALLGATEATGVELTDSMAMWPGSSVSGLYLGHPDAYYFGVAKVEADQVADYAARKGMAVAEAERWLAPILNYDPARQFAAE